MKAGAFTPAIRVTEFIAHRALKNRSMKAGAFTPAIRRRRPGTRGRRRIRSMKAGAFTPAIPGFFDVRAGTGGRVAQ